MKKTSTSKQEAMPISAKGSQRTSAVLLFSLLPFRLVFFAVFQVLITILLALAAVKNPWQASSAWWLITAALTNIITILLLIHLLKKEEMTYFQVFRFENQTVKKDLLVLLGIILLSGLVAMLPSSLGGQWIFGSTQIANNLLIQPLPLWAAWAALFIFPISIAFAELPIYFGYLMPRLDKRFENKWLAILLPVLFLAGQHMSLPLIFNGQFILWRLIAFLPFALMLGLFIHWRPRMLAYLMIVHGLIDMATAVLVLMVSIGMPIA